MTLASLSRHSTCPLLGRRQPSVNSLLSLIMAVKAPSLLGRRNHESTTLTFDFRFGWWPAGRILAHYDPAWGQRARLVSPAMVSPPSGSGVMRRQRLLIQFTPRPEEAPKEAVRGKGMAFWAPEIGSSQTGGWPDIADYIGLQDP